MSLKMNRDKIQERLQLKRAPVDEWSVREQLCLASAVARSGDQNWMSVSRSLKLTCGKRPNDWFTAKTCASQYGSLLEKVETPKRKKRSERDTPTPVEIPSQMILRKLTQERIDELKMAIEKGQQEYVKLVDEIQSIQGIQSEEKLNEMMQQIEAEKHQQDVEQEKYDKWLKERAERKLKLEMSFKHNSNVLAHNIQLQPSLSAGHKLSPLTLKIKQEDSESDDPNSRPGSAPLLTSLLKSPSPAPNNQSPVTPVAQSPQNTRSVAPTITNLLTRSNSGQSPIVNQVISTATNQFASAIQTLPLSGPPPPVQENTPIAAQSPSQSAPTLSMLLEAKNIEAAKQIKPSNADVSIKSENNEPVNIKTEDISAESPKEDEQELLEEFKNLIPENFDELASMLPDLLEGGLDVDPFINENEIKSPVQQVKDEPKGSPETFDLTQQKDSEEDSQSSYNKPSTSTTDAANKTETVVIPDDEQSNDSDDTPLAKTIEKAKMENEQRNALNKPAASTSVEKISSSESDSNDEKSLSSIKKELMSETKIEDLDTNSKDNSLNTNVDDEVIEIKNESDLKEESLIQHQTSITEEKQEIAVTTPPNIEETSEPDVILVKDNNTELPVEEVPETDDSIIIIEETDEKSDEPAPESVKMARKQSDTSDEPIGRLTKRRKISSDEEVFVDAKESLDTIGNEDTRESHTDANQETTIIIETDDDSPIESSSKDEKILRSKREMPKRRGDDSQSEKKSDENLTETKQTVNTRLKLRDRSESPFVTEEEANDSTPQTRRRYSSTPVIDSVPNSPASSTDERDYKAWKKSIHLLLSRLMSHKDAFNFTRSEEHVNYKSIIMRPMDLQMIKKNLDTGVIKTTIEFQRDVMLMCFNFMVFHRKDQQLVSIAKDFMTDAITAIDSSTEILKKESEKSHISTSTSASSANTPRDSSSNNSASKMRSRKSLRFPNPQY